jgi:hypothetical protein
VSVVVEQCRAVHLRDCGDEEVDRSGASMLAAEREPLLRALGGFFERSRRRGPAKRR